VGTIAFVLAGAASQLTTLWQISATLSLSFSFWAAAITSIRSTGQPAFRLANGDR
jgi:ABC-type molybdate transport system permease subunit